MFRILYRCRDRRMQESSAGHPGVVGGWGHLRTRQMGKCHYLRRFPEISMIRDVSNLNDLVRRPCAEAARASRAAQAA